MAKTSIDLNVAYQDYLRLPAQFDSLLMATVSDNGIPNASYAVYIQAMGNYYVFISELAAHTGNLRYNKQVSRSGPQK
jgi:putative heme iron utilization protein